jgi:prolyl oligopeptidase
MGTELRWAPLLICSLLSVPFLTRAFAGDQNALPAAVMVGSIPSPPKARVSPVIDRYHGHDVPDHYRWLEDAASPETQAFIQKENAYTRSVLDSLPGRDKIAGRLQELLSIGAVRPPTPGVGASGSNVYFYTHREGRQNQPVLYVRTGLSGKDRALIDVNESAADGTVALDWWYSSHDGKYIAYGISANGSEESTLHVIETATGRLLPEMIDRTRAASLAWMSDDSGFYYTRHPKQGDVSPGQEAYHRRVFFHRLGESPDGHDDALVFGDGLNPDYLPSVCLSEDDRWLVIEVDEGWSKSELYLKDTHSHSSPVVITAGQPFVYSANVYEGRLYILTNEGAARYRILRVSANHPDHSNWQEIIPQSEGDRGAVIDETKVVGGKLVLRTEKDANSKLIVYSLGGERLREIELPRVGSISELQGQYDLPDLFFDFQSFTTPTTIFSVNVAGQDGVQIWANLKTDIDPSAYEVKQVFYASKDGTQVPMFIVSRRGLQRNGKNPTLLNGYGGFDLSVTPDFHSSVFAWLEHGGIFAVANLRGGGEYGESWHEAGMLDRKQNVFDDFIAAGEYLIHERYTDKQHLAIIGTSNGGLVVAAAMTQRPDLFRAVVCEAPLTDMLRYQNFEIGKLWIPEFGSSADAKQFEYLYRYSPYHHVRQGTTYPAVLFLTGDTDTRVDPMHARKMTALMQAKARQGAERPILLRVEGNAGHGAGKPVAKLVDERTDTWSFLFWQLGMK